MPWQLCFCTFCTQALMVVLCARRPGACPSRSGWAARATPASTRRWPRAWLGGPRAATRAATAAAARRPRSRSPRSSRRPSSRSRPPHWVRHRARLLPFSVSYHAGLGRSHPAALVQVLSASTHVLCLLLWLPLSRCSKYLQNPMLDSFQCPTRLLSTTSVHQYVLPPLPNRRAERWGRERGRAGAVARRALLALELRRDHAAAVRCARPPGHPQALLRRWRCACFPTSLCVVPCTGHAKRSATPCVCSCCCSDGITYASACMCQMGLTQGSPRELQMAG